MLLEIILGAVVIILGALVTNTRCTCHYL